MQQWVNPCSFIPELISCIVLLVDVTVYYSGFHGDLNETMFVGRVDDASRHLVQTAYDCMMKAIEIGQSQVHTAPPCSDNIECVV